jgi:hypothetical protein
MDESLLIGNSSRHVVHGASVGVCVVALVTRRNLDDDRAAVVLVLPEPAVFHRYLRTTKSSPFDITSFICLAGEIARAPALPVSHFLFSFPSSSFFFFFLRAASLITLELQPDLAFIS